MLLFLNWSKKPEERLHGVRHVKCLTHVLGAEPDVPHVVADGLGRGHGAGQFTGFDDGGAAQLHRLKEEERRLGKRRLGKKPQNLKM